MKNKILVIACLVLVLCVSLVLPIATAFADYTEDVLNNPQAIVNFNQLVNNEYINGYSFPQYSTSITDNGIINGHTYFIKDSCDSAISREYYGGPVGSGFSFTIVAFNQSGINTALFTATQSADRIRVYCNTITYIKSLMIIDLTQMFGSNLPTLAQCQDLFVSDYYAYNTGTSMSFGGLDSYVRGFNDAIGSVEVSLDTTLLESNIFVNEGLVDTNVQGDYDWNISGANAEFGFYLPNNILLGDVVTISFNKLENHYTSSATTNFQVGYYSNGSFIVIATCNFSDLTIESSTNNLGIYSIVYSAYTFSFTSNTTLNALYFKLPSNNSSLMFDDLKLKVVTSNPYYAIQSSFQSGYKKAEDYYKDLYKVGGSAYQAIYNKGYYDYPNDDHFTFKSLITSAVDVPVQAFTNLFDFDILGVNMKTFYLSVFTLCVIFVVLRLVL